MPTFAPTMADMAPKSTKKVVTRTGSPLHVWIDPALKKALDQALKISRRKLNAEVAVALEEYLTKQGLWPPPPKAKP